MKEIKDNKPLTWDEIRAAYPDRCVFLDIGDDWNSGGKAIVRYAAESSDEEFDSKLFLTLIDKGISLLPTWTEDYVPAL